MGRGSPSIYIKLHQISREAELQDFKRLQDKNKNNNEWQEPGRVSRFRRFRLLICRVDSWAFY